MRSEFIAFYFFLLFLLSLFGIHLYWLLWLYFRHKDDEIHEPRLTSFPRVTVQLPVYNERHVIERLLNSVVSLDWPKDKLEIQVLDDSDDDTSEIIERVADKIRFSGITLSHIRRTNRIDFKAGALANGLRVAEGELVAIFDADCIPEPDFLRRTIPHFHNDKVAMVQTRWEFVNRRESLLCRAQALFLDSHFHIEQLARSRGGLLYNFNGSAGVWRKCAIIDSGGWSGETLTEDLDLSIRAQLAGWEFRYLDHVAVPTELPSTVRGFRSQQYRWAKGALETALVRFGDIWKSPIGLRKKVGVTLHLGHKLMNPVLVALAALLVPALYFRLESGYQKLFLIDLPIFILGAGSMSIFYGVAYRRENSPRRIWDALILPFLTSLGVALAVNNSRAVFSALLKRKTPFIRTPKSGFTELRKSDASKTYRIEGDKLTHLEAILAIYALVALVIATSLKLFFTLPFLATFAIGYSYLSILNYAESHEK